MHLSIKLFIVYFFSFLFNKLYFNIFKVLKRYIFKLPKLYDTYIITQKIIYFIYLVILFTLIFCKIYTFVYIYLLFIYKFFCKIYIDLQKNLKKNNTSILNFVFLNYWFNLFIHLKVLNQKFKNEVDMDLDFYSLKWNCCYYYYYIIYMLKDLVFILIWYIRLIIKFQWYILYLQIIFYFKNKKLKILYYTKLFIYGYIGNYFYSLFLFKSKKISLFFTFKKPVKKSKKVKLSSKLQFWYYRNKRLIKDYYVSNIKKPLLYLIYNINNYVEAIYYMLLKTGGNYIIYYIYKILKYLYSICVYIWRSDVIYKFFKLIERKKW